MSQLINDIVSQFGKEALASLGNSIGADQNKTQSAVALAVPLLVKALAKNSSDQDGATSLSNALEKGHDGSILGNLSSVLGSQQTGNIGQAILGHVLGSKMSPVTNMISKVTGLDANAAGTLIAQLAPVVMGFLGKKKKEEHLDESSMASLLDGASKEAEKEAPSEMGMITKLLDSDGDGDITDDLVNLGGSLLKGFLNK